MRFIIFFSLLLFAYPINLFAQQEYLFSHLHTHNGLASETVNAVQQDEKGFIWIATNNGLQRYDGKTFLTFQHKDNDKNSLPYSRVTWLKKDTHNRLWLLLEDNTVGYFNTSNFSFHEVPVRASKEDLHKLDGRLFTDSLGHIIFLLSGGSIYTYSEKLDEFASSHNPFVLPKDWLPLWLSYNSQYNNYWIGCNTGLVKYNVSKKTLSYRNHNADNDEIINALSSFETVVQPYMDKAGKFWIVSWPLKTGLAITSYDTKTKKKEQWQQSLYTISKSSYFEITSIAEQQDGNIWLTGLTMFARFSRRRNAFEFIPTNQGGEYSLRYDLVNSVSEDRERNLWVCTDKGLYRFNPSAQLFHTYLNRRYNKDSPYLANVSDFVQLKNKDLVVCTWGVGLFAYDSLLNPVKRNYVDEALKQYEGMVWCIHQRKNGDIWRGHQGGYLYIYYDSAKTTSKLIPEIFNGSTIRQIAEDTSGDLWLGTQSGLVVKWLAANNTFIKIKKFNSPVNRLYVDKQNNILICVRNNGVFRINSNTGDMLSSYTSTTPQGKRLMISGADDIVQYSDSIFLIASGDVNVLNLHTGSIRFIDPKNDAFSNTVTNLVFDKQGTLWITSQSGLYSMNMKTEVASNYDENDGIQPEAIGTAASYIMKDGRIAFGRAHDFVIFDPEKVKSVDFTPPQVTITGFKLMNKSLLTDSLLKLSSIEFPYNKNAVTIQFSTLIYKNGYAVQYKLNGLDKDWVLTNTNEAVYSYIPPGTYTFQVFAENADGLKSEKITELEFTVALPFWGTWWFYSLLALAAVALLYWFDKERLKRKAAFQLMRSDISDNLHEEVNNALQDINILSEIASIKADSEPLQSKNYISEINYKSRNMIMAMDDMLWSINPANDTMEKFITRAKEFAASISYSKHVAVSVQSDTQILLLKPDMKLRHELMMIYKTALSWLVNEMQASDTVIQLNYINHQLQLNMFAADIKAGIHESAAIREKLKQRTALINAILDILNEEKGVAIILSLNI